MKRIIVGAVAAVRRLFGRCEHDWMHLQVEETGEYARICRACKRLERNQDPRDWFVPIEYDKGHAPVTAGEVRALKRLSDEGRLPSGRITPGQLKELLECNHTNLPVPCAQCLGYADEREMSVEIVGKEA